MRKSEDPDYETELRAEMYQDLIAECCVECHQHPTLEGHHEECPTWEEE
tara:strand:+ start:257 stop:403 length:147 start_codon:yes stop_codon:yes gene_type:complete